MLVTTRLRNIKGCTLQIDTSCVCIDDAEQFFLGLCEVDADREAIASLIRICAGNVTALRIVQLLCSRAGAQDTVQKIHAAVGNDVLQRVAYAYLNEVHLEPFISTLCAIAGPIRAHQLAAFVGSSPQASQIALVQLVEEALVEQRMHCVFIRKFVQLCVEHNWPGQVAEAHSQILATPFEEVSLRQAYWTPLKFLRHVHGACSGSRSLRVVVLDLGNSSVSDDDIAAVVQLHMPDLRELHLDKNPITDSGMLPISVAFRDGLMPALRVITLSVTSVSDSGMVLLAEAAHTLRYLTELHFTCTQIGDKGISALIAASRNGALTSLQMMWMFSSNITSAGYATLGCAIAERAFPALKELVVDCAVCVDELVAACASRSVTCATI